jgi:acetoin utilization deacetylase AcuC-like enzyme
VRRYLAAMRARTVQAGADGGSLEGDFGNSACNTTRTEPAARVATAALIDAASAVASGALDTAFVVAKPPTHHAVGNADRCRGRSPRNLAFGFCHLNGMSAAAAAVIDAHPNARVAILDVDVHHGNGNEDTWYESSSVLHVNLNQSGIWPGGGGGRHLHGDPAHIGAKSGRGFNFNYPMEMGEGDPAYVWALLEHVIPRLETFQPTILFVACGFDALEGDPYASMRLSPLWFGWLAARLREESIAPLVFNMEGGYVVDMALCNRFVQRAPRHAVKCRHRMSKSL